MSLAGNLLLPGLGLQPLRMTFAFNSTQSLKNLSAIGQNFILISSFGDLDSATDGNLNTQHDWGQACDYKFLAEISFPLSEPDYNR